MSAIPSFRAGDSVTWVETEAPEGTASVAAYLQIANPPATGLANTKQITVAGVSVDSGWEFLLSSAATTPLLAGQWQSQVVATDAGAQKTTIRVTRFEISPSLNALTPFDLRTQLEKDLEAVDGAIRALTSGAQEYWVGTGSGGRKVRRADLSELIKWRAKLKSEIAAANAAESIANGLGNPRRIYIRHQAL